MKKLFGSKAKAVTPATAYEDLTGAQQQQQQQHHPPDAFVQAQQQQQRALASDPTSPVLAEYRHHHSRQEQERTIRKQQRDSAIYNNSNNNSVGGGGSDDNWEFVHNPALQRDDSAGALPNPHPPVIPSSRTSSLGSLPLLPPGASPPAPGPLPSPLPESVYNAPPGINQAPVSPSSMPFANILRKKPPPPAKEPPPQSNGVHVSGPAAILRSLEPRIQVNEKARSRKGSADSEVGHDSNHSHHPDVSDVERERDSKEIEREREWRERDREIRAAEDHRRYDNRDVERERERERESRQKQAAVRDRERERDKEKDRTHLDTRDGRRKKENSRERSRSKDREGKEDKKSQWATLFSKDARHDKEREEHEAEQLSRMIGFLTAQANIDVSMALDICERASANDMNAKQAAKSLRREFRYGETASQLSAARLWAIMTQNCKDDFIAHTNSKKFVECLENVITSSRTSPVVRDRLIDVLGTVAYKLSVQHRDTKESGKDNLRYLWRKYRPEGAPEEGVPASDDMLFSPTVSRPTARHLDSFASPPDHLRPEIASRKQSVNGVIPRDEDIRRLFQECSIGKGNAQLLNEALAFAGPDDLKEKDIIKEFYAKSRASKDLIETQISWAYSEAERAKAQQEAQWAQYNRTSPTPPTTEEKLLAELLKAHEDLSEVMRIYDDIERIGVEREFEKAVRERSRVETRHVPNYHDEYLETPGMVSSGSRSPSPSPQQHASHPLPQLPSLPQAPSIQTTNSYSSQNTHSLPSLAPPARTIRGPRSPAPPRSRSPSPARSSTPSMPGSRTHSRTSSIDGGFDPSRHTALGLAQANGKLPSPLHLEAAVIEPLIEPPTPIVKMSEKAMGKRKFVEPEPDDRLRPIDDEFPNDTDSLFNSTDFNDPDSPTNNIHYVYDASAERTKEWLKESGSHQSLH